jgi:hypothetical protein
VRATGCTLYKSDLFTLARFELANFRLDVCCARCKYFHVVLRMCVKPCQNFITLPCIFISSYGNLRCLKSAIVITCARLWLSSNIHNFHFLASCVTCVCSTRHFTTLVASFHPRVHIKPCARHTNTLNDVSTISTSLPVLWVGLAVFAVNESTVVVDPSSTQCALKCNMASSSSPMSKFWAISLLCGRRPHTRNWPVLFTCCILRLLSPVANSCDLGQSP